jgi:hypothetical protein
LRKSVIQATCLRLLARGWSFNKEMSIVGIIEDDKPLSLLLVAQPVVNELKYIRLRVVPARDLNPVRNFPKTLLEPGRVARVYPENPRLWRSVSHSVGVFDGKLRLSVAQVSGKNWPIPFGTYPTPPKPTSAILEADVELFSSI